jgi:hypothetical protein
VSIICGLSLLRRVSCVLLSGSAVFYAASVWMALCGLSAASATALAGALVAAWGLAEGLQRALLSPVSAGTRQIYPLLAAAGFGLVGFALLPSVLSAAFSFAVDVFSIGGSLSSLCIYSIPAGILCGLLALLFAVCRALAGERGRMVGPEVLSVMVALPAVFFPGVAGIHPVMLMAAFTGLAVVCFSLVAFPTDRSGLSGRSGSSWDRSQRVVHACCGVVAGLLTVTLGRFWGQLFPLNALQLILLVAVTAALTQALRGRSLGSIGSRILTVSSFLLLLLFAWLQSLLPHLFLAISERTSPGLLQQLLRAAAAGGISALLLCGLIPRQSSASVNDDRWFRIALAVALPISVCLCAFVSISGLLPAVLVPGALCAGALRLSSRDQDVFRLQYIRLWPAVLLASILTAIPLIAPGFDLPAASRLLFAGRTMEARGRGLSMDLIRYTEPARLAWTATGAGGELSVWRQSAVSFEVLRSGVVTAKASSDTRIQPQAIEEVLPAIFALCNHSRPGRVLLLGDDSGASLRTCTHFPVQQILAVRTDAATTAAAEEFLWRYAVERPDRDSRVQLLHADLPLAVRSQTLGEFDVVVVAGGPGSVLGHASLLTREFYASVRARLSVDGVFCQRLTLEHAEPELLRRVLATLAAEFRHAGVIQMLPGDFLLAASDSKEGLIHPLLLEHLQRGHVQREAAACGWDWAQISVLPLAQTAGSSGMFANTRPPQPLTAADGGPLLPLAVSQGEKAAQSEKLRAAFAPFQQQIASAVTSGEAHEEAKRRLAALQQQVEILAGMPDQPWTYRKSLRMEMQRSPRPPVEKVEGGKIIRSTHPLDQVRQDYFMTLGEALQSVQSAPERSLEAVRKLNRLSAGGEPLLGWFSHYEIVRLYELLQCPDPADELRHRLHLVFYAAPSDASVRPAISALQMLVEQPQLVADPAARYDLLNAVLQKLIERWEARTAWEPRSAVRVQQDVDLSVLAGRQAMEQMQELTTAAGIPESDFKQRRQFVHAALISPLRAYCEQVLAHRMKTEAPATATAEDPDDLPLLAPAAGISTN